MKPRTQKSIELYNTLLNRGFPQEFCEQISLNLNTDWTAQRMLGYLSHYRKLPMAEIVDEMLAMHMAHPNGRVCGAKRPKCEAERSHHL